MNYKKGRSYSVSAGVVSGLLMALVLVIAGIAILTACVEKQTVNIHVPIAYSVLLLMMAVGAGVLCALLINANNPVLSAASVAGIITISIFVIYLLSGGQSFLSFLIRFLTVAAGAGIGYLAWTKLSQPKRRKYRNR